LKKIIFETTLKKIRVKQPCEEGWAKLLAYLGKTKADNEPLNILTIIKSNGVQYALWALQAVDHPDRDRVSRLMACDFAESVLPIFEKKYPDNKRPRECIKVARMYARGKADDKQMAAARDATWDATWAAELDTAWAARSAAWAAERAAEWAAARAAARDAAWAAEATDHASSARPAEEKKQAAIIKKYLAVSP